MSKTLIGASPPHLECSEKVTGQTLYIDDLCFPNVLVGRILRSAHPHARIIAVHTEAALAIRGVRAVVTGRDFPKKYGLMIPDETVLAVDKVRYVGDEVAAVAAETEDAAEQAIEAITVDYEPLPAVFDPEAAMQTNAPLVHENVSKNITIEYPHPTRRCSSRLRGFRLCDRATVQDPDAASRLYGALQLRGVAGGWAFDSLGACPGSVHTCGSTGRLVRLVRDQG